MLKMIEPVPQKQDRIIPMSEMIPLQVGVVVSGVYAGAYVMRSAARRWTEIMSISDPCENSCWCNPTDNDPKVRLLEPGEKIVIELFNED